MRGHSRTALSESWFGPTGFESNESRKRQESAASCRPFSMKNRCWHCRSETSLFHHTPLINQLHRETTFCTFFRTDFPRLRLRSFSSLVQTKFQLTRSKLFATFLPTIYFEKKRWQSEQMSGRSIEYNRETERERERVRYDNWVKDGRIFKTNDF